MENEIQLYNKFNDPLSAIERLGTFIAKSGLVPCEKTETGIAIAFILFTEKITLLQFNRTYDIVDGHIRKKAMASLAEFRKLGGKHKWVKTGDDGKEAEIELTFEGQTVPSKFTIEEAKLQGLLRPNSNWVKTPGNMLRARATSNGVAMLCPEIFAGEDGDMPEPAKAENPLSKIQPDKPAPIVEAQVITETPKTETPQQAQDKPFSPHDVHVHPSDPNKLSVETMAALQKLIGEHEVKVIEWLTVHNWIKNKDIATLSVDHAKRIFTKPDEFMGHIAGKK